MTPTQRYVFLACVMLIMLGFIYLVAEPVDAEPPSPPQRSRHERWRTQPPKVDVDAEIPFFQGPRPLTRDQLGRRGWGFLHTMVSNYAIEEGETEADKLTMVSDFLLMWAKLYPCRVCGGHFEEMLKRSPPPKNGTRADLEIWLCERHNEVNVRRGRDTFSCDLSNLRKRYVQTDGCPLE